jgi:glutathionyl-hydroquinone reductase
VNPSQVIPVGPAIDWTAPHGREALGGSPFGDGTPPEPDDSLVTYPDMPPER